MLDPKNYRVWFGATLLMCAISCGGALNAQEKQPSSAPASLDYRIGIGDRIKVDVWRHRELSKTVVVNGQGSITLPSVKSVKASGLSPMDLASLLRDKLERKISNPQVTVTVVSIASAPLSRPEPSIPLLQDPPPPSPESPTFT